MWRPCWQLVAAVGCARGMGSCSGASIGHGSSVAASMLMWRPCRQLAAVGCRGMTSGRSGRSGGRRRSATARPGCLYNALGLKPGSSGKQIKVAYRKLALVYHPDRQHPGGGGGDKLGKLGGGRFMAAADAFAVLGHPSRRATYDRDHGHPAPSEQLEDAAGSAAAARGAAGAATAPSSGSFFWLCSALSSLLTGCPYARPACI